MGYDVAIIAAIGFPSGGAATWHAAHFTSGAYVDWPPPLVGDDDPATVEQVVSSLAKFDGVRLLHQRRDSAIVELVAVVTEDIYLDLGARLLSAYRCAAEHGASGRVDVVGYLTSSLAFGLYVHAGTSRISRYSQSAVASIERTRTWRWLDGQMQGAVKPMPGLPKNWRRRVWEEAESEASPATGSGGYIVSGRIELRSPDCRRWMKTEVDPAKAPDVIERNPGLNSFAPRDLHYQLEEATPATAAFRIIPGQGEAWIRGAVPADEQARWLPLLTSTFASAAQFNATGQLRILSSDGHGGYVLDITPGDVVCRLATAQDHAAALRVPLHQEAVAQFSTNLASAKA